MTTESHTCSYNEILRFKKSAAVVSAKDPSVNGISSAESGLVQTIVDNFDADIHSLKGILQPTGESIYCKIYPYCVDCPYLLCPLGSR